MAETSAEPIADAELEHLFSALRAHSIDTLMLAVSGGTDSLALLHLFARHTRLQAAPPRSLVVTVDHGLRPESAAEAAFVAGEAARLGLPHDTLLWSGTKPATGRQEAAREARYALMGQRLAREPGRHRALLTAHTADDQAETLLMRLARGSGVDGLAGMAPVRPLKGDSGILLIRPLLDVPRARLAASLDYAGLSPKNDPSNADKTYERVRVRAALQTLAPLGLTPAALTRSAARLRRAQEALESATRDVEARIALIRPGLSTSLDKPAFLAAPTELRVRLLARALARHRGTHSPAELAQIESLAAAVERRDMISQNGATLGGCAVQWHTDKIVVLRELGREGLPEITLAPAATLTFDNRFEVSLSTRAAGPVTVRALPADIWPKVKQIYAGAGLSAAVAQTLPSFWRDDNTLLALPAPESLMPSALDQHLACVPSPACENSLQCHSSGLDAAGCSLRTLPRDLA